MQNAKTANATDVSLLTHIAQERIKHIKGCFLADPIFHSLNFKSSIPQ